MRRIQAEENLVSIRFSGERPPGRRALAALVRRALSEAGRKPWRDMELACFDAGTEALVIARPGLPEPPAFFFPDLERLLAGALSCPDGESALYSWDGGYILTVSREAAGPGLYEFGRPAAFSGALAVHAREQGLCILPENAVACLRRAFST